MKLNRNWKTRPKYFVLAINIILAITAVLMLTLALVVSLDRNNATGSEVLSGILKDNGNDFLNGFRWTIFVLLFVMLVLSSITIYIRKYNPLHQNEIRRKLSYMVVITIMLMIIYACPTHKHLGSYMFWTWLGFGCAVGGITMNTKFLITKKY